MITKQELKIKHGDNITFLFKGREPFTETHNNNPAGVLIERNGKILCFECGRWFRSVGAHVKTHKLTSDEYKMKYGFNLSTGICSKEISRNASENIKRIIKEGRFMGVKLTKELAQKLIKNRKPPRQFRVMQFKNSQNTCPEQYKKRLKLVLGKYGRRITADQMRETDYGVYRWLYKKYGSWNIAKIALRLTILKARKVESDLVYDLREYIRAHNSLPWLTHMALNGFPHCDKTYIDKWGSMSKTYAHCGIVKRRVGRMGKRNIWHWETIN